MRCARISGARRARRGARPGARRRAAPARGRGARRAIRLLMYPNSARGDGKLAIPLPSRVEVASSPVFVGRAYEREHLDSSMKTVAAGERRVVLVSGEPGIGKTSLAAAFAARPSRTAPLVLYGRCDDELGIPYQPWAEILAHLVGHATDEVLEAHVAPRERAGTARSRSRSTARRGRPHRRATRRPSGTSCSVRSSTSWDGSRPWHRSCSSSTTSTGPTVRPSSSCGTWCRPMLRCGCSCSARSVTPTSARDHPLVEALATLHREEGVERLALRGLGDEELLTLLETAAGHAMVEGGAALRDALAGRDRRQPVLRRRDPPTPGRDRGHLPGRARPMGHRLGPADVGPPGQHPRSDRPARGAPGRADTNVAVPGRDHRSRLRREGSRPRRRARRGHGRRSVRPRRHRGSAQRGRSKPAATRSPTR